MNKLNTQITQHKNQITFAAGALIAGGFLAKWLGNPDLSNWLLILATVIAAVPIALKAWMAIRMRTFSIELLVTIAVIGALFIQEYTESSVVTFLFLFGDYLEARTLEKTRSSLRELTEMAPQEAIVLRDGVEEMVGVDEVEIGDQLLIKPGGKIPVDGKITKGSAAIAINEATVTGESVPADKSIGDKIFAGTVLEDGFIEMTAEKVGDDTTFAKIIELVEEAQETKSKAERFLDKFANIYTPAVVVLSVLVYLMTRDLHLSITFLVIACPGALVIGAPVSNVAGIGNGAKNGVLIKGGDVMDKLSKVDTLIFDKTGTLTKGKPEVTDIQTFAGQDRTELLRLVAIAEKMSEHHLGKTIVKHAKEENVDVAPDAEEATFIKGNGLTATVEGRRLVVGNRKLLETERIPVADEIALYAVGREKMGNSAIFAAVDGQLKGIFSIADQIREDAPRALADMRKHGVKKIIMLTGDNQHTAKAVADQLGLDEYYAELLPEDKVAHVKRIKDSGAVVAMAGDGINDAPAIATADIGLAMGEGGTDVSMETADVVLMADKLMQYAHAYALAKATMNNMKQNIFIAVAVVIFLLAGVLMGSVHLANGMFIHEASVLIVIMNAMRLINFNRKTTAQERLAAPAARTQTSF